MKVEEIMSTPVIFTQPVVKITHLKDQFSRKNINAIPVMEENGDISGIVTSSDLVAVHDESLTVNDIKTKRVHIAVPHHRIKDAAKMMVKNNCHHLVVMDDGKVVGMLSSMDLIKAYAEE
jgi:CBS domain-containing protein